MIKVKTYSANTKVDLGDLIKRDVPFCWRKNEKELFQYIGGILTKLVNEKLFLFNLDRYLKDIKIKKDAKFDDYWEFLL